MEGGAPEFEQPQADEYSQQQYAQQSEQAAQGSGGDGGSVICKVCLSECQAGWAMCPFCGNNLK